MEGRYKGSKAKTNTDYTSLAVKLKKQMNDVIDVAYSNSVSPSILAQFKRFTIECSNKDLATYLGQCKHNKDKSSSIKIFAVGTEGFREILITTMHEVSHHIDRSLRNKTGHDKDFYEVHKKLLFASFDMGIISRKDVVRSESNARNRNKLANMMSEYRPKPVSYKEGIVQICVYNSFSVKNILKERNYKWNNLDLAWMIELDAEELASEIEFLKSLNIEENNIKVIEGSAVISRLRKNARLYNVPYEKKEFVKDLGYRWINNGKNKYWEKKINEDRIPNDEYNRLKDEIPGIEIIVV